MSVKINSLAISPTSVNVAQGENAVEISWNARMTAATDNPVNIELSIQQDSPVFFVSTANQHEKEVAWSRNFNLGKGDYTETVVIVVTQAQAQSEQTKLTMVCKGANGVSSRRVINLMYQ